MLNFWNLIKWDTSIIATLVKFETNRKMYVEVQNIYRKHSLGKKLLYNENVDIKNIISVGDGLFKYRGY